VHQLSGQINSTRSEKTIRHQGKVKHYRECPKCGKRFYTDFNVENILIKAIPSAYERIKALNGQGYVPLNRKFMIYDNYFVRKQSK
jgi:hypothetical protein